MKELDKAAGILTDTPAGMEALSVLLDWIDNRGGRGADAVEERRFPW